MKNLLFTLLVSVVLLATANAQKLTPNVDLVSELISQKQEELKQRVLKNIVVKNIKTTNYTTYNTTYRLVEILTTEKNKTVMTKHLMSEISNYSVTYSLSTYFLWKNEGLYTSSGEKSEYQKQEEIYQFLSENINPTNKDNYIKQEYDKRESSSQVIPKDVLFNYVVDTLNSLLFESDYLTSKGLFKENKKYKKFDSGLDLDFSAIKSSGKETEIVDAINKFVNNIDKVSDAESLVFSLINKDVIGFEDLKILKKSDIKNILELFSISLDEFREQVGRNSFIAKIGDVIENYVIFDMNKDDSDNIFGNFKIDIEAIILGLEEEFYNSKITGLKKHKVGIEPFFGIGINYGILTNDNNIILDESNTESIYQLAYVSEKFGFKFLFADFEYTRSHKPLEWFQYRGAYRRWKSPVKEPLINNVYGMVYASGIIYNIVDLKSEDNYDFAMLGAGFGLTFFNDLELNISYSVPLIKGGNPFESGMVNLGFDIPIFEYIKALKKKN